MAIPAARGESSDSLTDELTDEHLQDALLLSVSSVLPDFHKLASAKQHQPSH